MNRKACLIFNPIAGQGDPERDLAQIQELLSSEIELDIRMTNKEVDADVLAQKAIKDGAETIIVSGGDGTISAVADVLIETDIPLGIIPRGTANAFAAALNIPDNIQLACEIILTGKTKKIDAARCNGKPMVLLTSIGFEAEVIDDTTRQAKNRWGILAYLQTAIQELSHLQNFEVEIETEDKIVHTIKVGAVGIANAAPPISIFAQGPAEIIYDDGLLDVTIVVMENWTEAIAASFHLLRSGQQGQAAQRNDIGYLRARSVKINANPPQKVAVDGENIGTTPVEIKCIPGGLNLFVPKTVPEKPLEKFENLPKLQVESKL
jgi:YegS/Rv2252/BmrU family lipid kinase